MTIHRNKQEYFRKTLLSLGFSKFEYITNSLHNNLLIILAAFISLFSVAFAYTKTPEEMIANQQQNIFVGDWEGDKSFADGWSEWSTSIPASSVYVKSAVYIPVESWGSRQWHSQDTSAKYLCSPEEQGCQVVKPDGLSYESYDCSQYVSCQRQGGKDSCAGHDYSCSGCSGWTNYDTSNYRGCTSGYNGDGYCSLSNCTENNSKPCYGMWIYVSYSIPRTCSRKNGSYYYQTGSFKNSLDKANWKRTLSEAGGYGEKVYIYSYPERVFIKYEGMGANGLCSSWKAGTNNVNSNTNIEYVKGNPICNINFTNGTMENSYISYYPDEASGNYVLSENQYYKIGYDFKGWVSDPNALNGDGTLKQGYSVRFIDKASLTSGGRDTFSVSAGAYVTLYAVWEKYAYEITYDYYCGKGDTLETSYYYQEGLNLEPLNVSNGAYDAGHLACDTSQKNGSKSEESNTTFEGWYLDSDYINKVEKLPSSYYTDLTLYAKLSQKRYFYYTNTNSGWWGQWEYAQN